MRYLRLVFIAGYVGLAVLPLVWLVGTSFKERFDSISVRAKWVPSLGAVDREGPAFQVNAAGYRQLNQVYTGADHTFFHYLGNSVLIGLLSTLASVAIGTCAAYGFSRFRIGGARDWLFFILSTRFCRPWPWWCRC